MMILKERDNLFESIPAGRLLAHFKKLLGSSFKYSKGYPKRFYSYSKNEEELNNYLVKITSILSNGGFRNMSILDLPSIANQYDLQNFKLGSWLNQPFHLLITKASQLLPIEYKGIMNTLMLNIRTVFLF